MYLHHDGLQARGMQFIKANGRYIEHIPIIPSLLVGGITSAYASKGLFYMHKITQQTMLYGMEWLKENTRGGSKTPVVADVFTKNDGIQCYLQRKGASCGCMCPTRTGIFYIQACDLNVFKASPWGVTTPDAASASLSIKAKDMYELALKNNHGNVALNTKEAWQQECYHLLLHMILSDIKTITETGDTNGLKESSLALVEMIRADGATSKSILNAWAVTEKINDWIACVRLNAENNNIRLFCNLKGSTTDSSSVWGVEKWGLEEATNTSRVFTIECELNADKVDCWDVQPRFEYQRGNWGHIGRIRYGMRAAH
jgi:hypothetical protein